MIVLVKDGEIKEINYGKIKNKYYSLMEKLANTKSFFLGKEEYVLKQERAANIKGLKDDVRLFLDGLLELDPDKHLQMNIDYMKDKMISSLEQVMSEAENYQIKEIPSMH